MKGKRTMIQVHLTLTFVALMYAINPTIVKIGTQVMPAYAFTTVRLFVAMISFFLLILFTKSYRPMNAKDLRSFLWMGIGAFMMQMGLIHSVKVLPAAVVSTIIALMPVSVMVLRRIFLKKKAHWNGYIGALISIIGIAVIAGLSFQEGGLLSANMIGIVYVLMAQFGGAIYTVISEKMVKKYSHYQVTAMMFGVTLMIFLPISLQELIRVEYTKLSAAAWYCIVHGGLISLCAANALYIWGVKKIGSHRTAIYNNLPPAFAVILGIAFFNETPSFRQLLGISLVVMGLAVFNVRTGNRKSQLNAGKEIA